ncbi:MAG: pilus assembly protein [Novosphingobium sp.]|nr:pilus assembly protein [Novosphingobium sp.]
MIPFPALFGRLRRHTSGIAATEAAFALPFLLGAGLWGLEVANYAVVNMRVSQLAFHLADNTSRIGDTSALENRKIYEADITDLMQGADIQGGRLDLFKNGRAIISSVEAWDADGNCAEPGDCPASIAQGSQFVHWQRCKGEKAVSPVYGREGDPVADGIGPDDRKVAAPDGGAVIFVELHYTYQPLISARFVTRPDIQAVAAFVVRDSRDLTGIKQRNPLSPDPVESCGTYDSFAS